MKKVLENFSCLHNKDVNEQEYELPIDDEESLTFQLLNQNETEFERRLFNLKKQNELNKITL